MIRIRTSLVSVPITEYLSSDSYLWKYSVVILLRGSKFRVDLPHYTYDRRYFWELENWQENRRAFIFFYHGTSDHDLRDGLKISGYLTLNSKFPRTQTSRTSVQYSILCVNTIIFGFSKNKLHTRLCLYSLMQTNSMQRKHSTKFGRMCRVLLIGKPKVSLKKMLPRSKKHHRSVLEFFLKKETELFARCCSRKSW